MGSDPATPFPDVQIYGHGGLGPPPHIATRTQEGVGVTIRERGCELVLHFAGEEPDAPLIELRLGADPRSGKQLDPSNARQFVPQLELYLALARAALSMDGDDFRSAAAALRAVGRPGRGLSDDFFYLIATHYKRLVFEGEQHPVKALGEIHHVTIGAASRWVTEARRRGLIPTKEASSDAS